MDLAPSPFTKSALKNDISQIISCFYTVSFSAQNNSLTIHV